eukprot:gnl/MRDRNA2_/MRDRNA2_99435_c0_seq1.p1 gnl/MRDRNA2_/MRDRNA2_99435_c0~~gnl/MRDRNA2_/MRDRNA2_99435_c0_seq1.p1  ORF type:complete len:743 (-),score=231.52 gnl/MRDRNA2_/MRDRNA2_99435_c0_seq1:6-2051(-)
MEVTPMEKVKSLLAQLKKEIEEEAEVEAKMYAEFERWCDLEVQQCNNDIAGAKTRITEHESNIDEAKAGITRLGYEMEKLALEVSHKEQDLEKSTGLREKEHAEFVEAYDTLQRSIDVLDKALAVLSKKISKETLLQAQHAVSLVLRQTNAIGDGPNQMKDFFQQVAVEPQAQHTFLVQDKQPVQGSVYEGKSDQVQSVIQQMKDDIVEQQRSAGKDEETKAHAFEMYKQSMENELKGLQKQIDNVRTQTAELNAKVAEEEQARTDAATYLEKTEQYLTDTKTGCEEKARQWVIRSKGREEEMGAIDEATKVLSSDRADEMRKYERGSATTLSQVDSEVRVPSFLQLRSRASQSSVSQSGLSFLQVRRGGGADALTQRMVHAMQADPFGKVKKMIENMVVKLLEEQAQEQEHKAWCDAETAKTTKQEKYHARNSQKFNSRIEEMNAEIAELNEGIQDRSQDLDAMNAAAAKATEIRNAEKKEAEKALKDYADAQQMLQKAVQVLTDFYQKQRASAASAASLLQQGQGVSDGLGSGAAQPQTFEGTDAAASREGAAQNILNILEISLSDFTKLESETQTEEEAAQKEYDTYMQEYKVQKAVAEKEREHFTMDLAKLEDSVKTTSKDLAETDKELAAAREYLDKLKTTCDFSGSSYEERQARREAELKSLQNALAIISGEAIP